MKIELRELQDDIENLTPFAFVNGGNDIGRRLKNVLEFASLKLKEEKDKEEKLKKEIKNVDKPLKTDGIVKF